jgi:hypothetical protein
MTPPNLFFVQRSPASDLIGQRSAHAFTAYPIVKHVASDHFAASASRAVLAGRVSQYDRSHVMHHDRS